MATWQEILATGLRGAADSLDGRQTVRLPDRAGPGVVGLTAFIQLVGPVIRIVEGRGNLKDDVAAANAVMDAVALLFPQTAPTIANIELLESAALWLIGAVHSGAIKGGIPVWYPPGGGPGPYRGR